MISQITGLFEHFRDSVRTTRKTFAGAGSVVMGAVLAGVAVLLRDAGISKTLGRTSESDSLFAGLVVATALAQLVPTTFQSSVFSFAVGAKLERGVDAMRSLLGAISLRFAAFATGIALFLVAGSYPIAHVVGTASGAARLSEVLSVLGVFVVGMALTELARSILGLERHYVAYAVVGCIGNVILVVLILSRRPETARQIAMLASVAFFVSTPIAWAVCRGLGLVRFGVRVAGSDKNRISRQMPPSFGAGLLTIAMSVVDQIFTISLGSGSYATLSYAQRWPLFAAQLPAFAVGTVLLRSMSEDLVLLGTTEFREETRRSAKLAFGFGLFVCLGGLAIGPLLVRLTLRFGEFSAADATGVIEVQRVFFLIAPFYMAGTVYLRLLNVLKRNGSVFLLGALSLALNVILDWSLTRFWQLGVRGIALATVFVYMWSCLSLVLVGERRLRSHTPQSCSN